MRKQDYTCFGATPREMRVTDSKLSQTRTLKRTQRLYLYHFGTQLMPVESDQRSLMAWAFNLTGLCGAEIEECDGE